MRPELPDLSGLKVLVAEDNATSLEVVCTMLATMGARTIGARDGLDALEKVRANRPDLILLDLEMPEMSGLDVLQVLAGDADAPPVLCLTGHTAPEYVERVTNLGAAGLLGKPIQKLDALGERVLHAVGQRAKVADVAHLPNPQREALDLEVFRPLAEMMGPEMIRKVLAQMETDIGQTIGDLETASREGDFGKARSAAHVMVSVSGSVGARQLMHRARQISAAAQKMDLDRLQALASGLRKLLDDLICAISAEVDRP